MIVKYKAREEFITFILPRGVYKGIDDPEIRQIIADILVGHNKEHVIQRTKKITIFKSYEEFEAWFVREDYPLVNGRTLTPGDSFLRVLKYEPDSIIGVPTLSIAVVTYLTEEEK